MKRTWKGTAAAMSILLLSALTMGGCASGSGETKEISSVSAGGTSSEASTAAEAEAAGTEAAAETEAVSVEE